jgi:hypothetical protein
LVLRNKKISDCRENNLNRDEVMQCSANTGSFEQCGEFGQSVLIVMSEKGSKEVWLTDYRRGKH